ncbi:MAG: hypothetical protein IKW28_10485, partial [Lachnospiraceae bacterium]|nr:hypothetical protein [Lachnospiraceae bacterium]
KFMSKPVVTDADGKVLKAGQDYDTAYFNAEGTEMTKKDTPQAGSEITVKVTGKGLYNGGTLTETYTITELDFTKAKIKIKAKAYTGDSIILTKEDIESVVVNKVDITKDFETSYEIVEGSYSNNVKKGTAKVTLKGLGNYGGNKTVTFKITTKNFVWFWNLFQ